MDALLHYEAATGHKAATVLLAVIGGFKVQRKSRQRHRPASSAVRHCD
jgi:hypothetical protein